MNVARISAAGAFIWQQVPAVADWIEILTSILPNPF